MDDTAKYLINATITADGVVERTDVVGAIYGQTEGLLGEDLDLRDLQDSSRVGRIDVEIDSEGGRSFGDVTIASSLDRVETAILAAALETITRVGPCQARVEVTAIEDVRAAKRRIVVQRATELLRESFDDGLSSQDIVSAVREAARDTDDVGEYRGLPAGPRVPESDAIVVVEGRADVAQLLRSGVKNAIAVEGTNVPDVVADLTAERTTTAFLDGDRGGELILRELVQVGDVDYVAAAPEGRAVEDLSPEAVTTALRAKRPYEVAVEEEDWAAGDPADAVVDGSGESAAAATGGARGEATPSTPDAEDRDGDVVDGDMIAPHEPERSRAAVDAADGADAEITDDSDDATEAGTATGDVVEDPATVAADGTAVDGATDVAGDGTADDAVEAGAETPDADVAPDVVADDPGADVADEDATDAVDRAEAADVHAETDDAEAGAESAPPTLREHVRDVVGAGTGKARLLDGDLATRSTVAADEAFEAVDSADPVPHALVLDGELTQRLLDVCAQRGVDHVVARTTGEFVKQPVSVRVRTADELLGPSESED